MKNGGIGGIIIITYEQGRCVAHQCKTIPAGTAVILEKSLAEPTAYATNISQQPIQPQIVINNSPQNTMGFTPGISRKNKIVALLLCIFLGYFGAHKFYVGKVGMGILYLFTMGFFGIGWLIDVILIATGSFKDEFGLPLKN